MLQAAADARVRKVVLTSSTVALPMVSKGTPPVDETHWADDLRVPYFRAKTLGERAAWQTARALRLNLVAVLPGSIIGPGFIRNTPTVDVIEAMRLGAFRLGVPDLNMVVVDVRDAAAAHVLAGERDCEGRFAVCNDAHPTMREILEILHRIDPHIALPKMTAPSLLLGAMPLIDRVNHLLLGTPRIARSEVLATMKGRVWSVSNQRVKNVLGWRPTVALEQSLRDTLTVLKSRRGAS
jgi:dihydroflavonol-4-reductase